MSVNKIDVEKKRAEEKKLLSVMIGIYCRGNHGGNERIVRFLQKTGGICAFQDRKMPIYGNKDFLQCL